MSASRRLGRWRLDRCGLWDDWFWQLEARDEAVDASLELVEYRQQVGRCGGLRHSALDANLAWRCKHGRAFRVRPAGAGALRDDLSVVRGVGRAVLCLSVCPKPCMGQGPAPLSARVGTTPYSTSGLTAIVQLPEGDLDVLICRGDGGGGCAGRELRRDPRAVGRAARLGTRTHSLSSSQAAAPYLLRARSGAWKQPGGWCGS